MADTDGHSLEHRWTKLDNERKSLLSLAWEYARWTLPYMFPNVDAESTKNTEMQVAYDSIGAQAVNHLGNKVVSTLFPAKSMFFRLMIDTEAREKLEALAAQQDRDAGEVAQNLAKVDKALKSTEDKCQDYMNMVAYRPQAVRAAQLLIITGNALDYHPPDKPAQVYSMRDYVVVRDLSGEVIEMITRESKAFETFHPDIQAKLKASKDKQNYEDRSNVTIYTQIKLENDGKFHIKQHADLVDLNLQGAIYPKNKLPWIPLTWNLIRGEDYGRGLVGDYAGAFHAINTLCGALLNIAAIMGDIKFLVKPSSLIDVAAINASEPGTYHAGNPDDIATIKIDRYNEAQFIQTMIERYEKQISQAFLLMQTRNAERVTAEEIRMDADALEMSNGGIYSRLAHIWQQPLANVLLDQVGFEAQNGITPKVVTGLDSLSRTSELDNMRMWIMDIANLNGVPEDVRAQMNLRGYMEYAGTNRGVEWQKVVKTETQIQADQQAAQAAAAQQEQQKAAGSVATEAGKAAVQGA